LEGLKWKISIYFMAIWNILQTLGIFYDRLVHFVSAWYIFSGFGVMYHKNLATLVHCRAKFCKRTKSRNEKWRKKFLTDFFRPKLWNVFCGGFFPPVHFFLPLNFLSVSAQSLYQCCQIIYWNTKNPNPGLFGRALEWKYYWPFGIFYGHYT
jgi:hypothetical protein